MLTNLNWLADGEQYPPAAEKERISQYRVNEQLFLTKHSEAWRSDFETIARQLRKKNYDVETVFNYQQLLSKKTADFVCGEPATIETEGNTDELKKLLDRQGFNTKLYESIIDISRYGNGIPKIVGTGLSIVSPVYWFPIVDPADLKNVVQHVIAYPTNSDAKGVMTELYVEIHNIGSIEQRTYSYDGNSNTIGKQKDIPKIAATGLQDFAIQPLTNITHSGSIYGLDDYTVINSIVAKIMWRLHCADIILDKHSEPSVSGPESALDFDAKTGMYFLNLATYFKRNSDQDVDVHYITWDGNLESNFKEIEKLLEQLYILSEMGQAFMEGGGGGAATSGTALKLRMVSPRIKAARIANMNAAPVKKLISMLAQVNGITLNYDTINIKWNDGLPVDEVEQVNNLVNAIGGKAIMSQYSALKARGLSDADVEAELEQMAEETARSAPVQLGIVDQNKNEPDGGGDGDVK